MAKMKQYFSLKTGALALSCIALAACSGGSEYKYSDQQRTHGKRGYGPECGRIFDGHAEWQRH